MVRLTRPETDRSLDALSDRVARLEAELGLGSSGSPAGSDKPAGWSPPPEPGAGCVGVVGPACDIRSACGAGSA